MRRFILALLFCACEVPPGPVLDAGVIEEVDAGIDAGVVDAGHKADGCAPTFGEAFTNAFGRADGTVTAVIPSAWTCPLPNNDHLVIQVSIDGATAASAHLIHRNGQQNDGAIVVDPTGAQPTWLLFHFANQTF